MTGVDNNHDRYEQIAALLSDVNIHSSTDSGVQTRASVAMILNQTADDVEILFIQRANHKNDPWSGHIAFPGGKLEEGELVCDAARRETFEEIGIDLGDARYLGQLRDIFGANLPVRVSCCLFGIDRPVPVPTLNDEVSDLFWMRLSDLLDRERHLRTVVSFDDRTLEVPAIRLSGEHRPVLWGITYRLLMDFLELLGSTDSGVIIHETAEGASL
jgi:8-oxo-dGTP pyrophosphatase MutT (NUDIX family)